MCVNKREAGRTRCPVDFLLDNVSSMRSDLDENAILHPLPRDWDESNHARVSTLTIRRVNFWLGWRKTIFIYIYIAYASARHRIPSWSWALFWVRMKMTPWDYYCFIFFSLAGGGSYLIIHHGRASKHDCCSLYELNTRTQLYAN